LVAAAATVACVVIGGGGGMGGNGGQSLRGKDEDISVIQTCENLKLS
jgi:hypothetical protein